MAVTIRGSGQVPVQIVQATYAVETSTSSTSYVSTGLSASITPTNSLNRILVLANGIFYNNSSNRGIRVGLIRSGTTIYNPPVYSIYTGFTNIVAPQTITFLDNPATTSAITYTFSFATPEGAAVFAQYNNAPSILTLMEVAYA